ncbi:MAG: hypothetical protein HYZ93_07035 [Candidatus Omnitrophica bacterium]|nr:hypothetical protein [Candidatus Omnitrophota bacterium]
MFISRRHPREYGTVPGTAVPGTRGSGTGFCCRWGQTPALFLLAGLLALGALNGELGGLGGDNAAYILLAKSLVTGQGYRSIWQPGAPPHTAYPFGFPLILAPIVALRGTHAYLAMHGMVIGWALLALILWIRWVRAETTAGIAWAGAVCLVTTPLWLASTQQILSEFPYLAFSLLALLCAQKLQRGTVPGLILAPGFVGLCLALLAAYFTRTVGITLIATAAASLFWADRRDRGKAAAIRRLALLAACLLPPILAWTARDLWATRGPVTHYARLFLWADPYAWDRGPLSGATLLHRIGGNLSYYVAALGREMVWPTNLAGSWAAPWVGGALALLMAAGFFLRWSRRSIAERYILCYAALFLVWPYQESRFLLPVLPWLWLYLLEGGRLVARLKIAVVTCNLAGCLWLVGLNLSGFHVEPVFRGFLAAHEWLRLNTPKETIVMTRKPTITALLSDRRVVWIPYTGDDKEFLSILRDPGVDVVLDDGLFRETALYLVPAVRRHLDLFEPEVIRFGPTSLLRVKRAPAGRRA